jgi:DNA-binding NarL/FixJ family response regulator
MRVLIVDDHAGFPDGLKDVLTTCGFVVLRLASNGRDAGQQAVLLRPQVVLMDVNMPGMDGVEATRLIRAKLPQVQVVGLSMNETVRARREIGEAGASAYLNKSASIEEICDSIRAAVPN